MTVAMSDTAHTIMRHLFRGPAIHTELVKKTGRSPVDVILACQYLKRLELITFDPHIARWRLTVRGVLCDLPAR